MDSSITLQGSMVALVTPMIADGAVDKKRVDALVDMHLEQGTNAIVAVGTSGESATLSVSEHIGVVEQVVKRVDGRIPVIAGTGANSTSEAIELTRDAKAVGANACLLVVPYYNKPTQEGLYGHFSAIADAVSVPQVLYNVPGRTITDLNNDTALRLATHNNIIGIKDATGDLEQGKALIDAAYSVLKAIFRSLPMWFLHAWPSFASWLCRVTTLRLATVKSNCCLYIMPYSLSRTLSPLSGPYTKWV